MEPEHKGDEETDPMVLNLRKLEAEGYSPEMTAHYRKRREEYEARRKKALTEQRARQTLKDHPHLFQP